MDDFGIAANNATDLTLIIRAIFQCIRQAGSQLIIGKCYFGIRQVEFLGRTFSSQGVSPQSHKIKFFEEIGKGSAALSGLRKLLQNFYSQNGWKAQSIQQSFKSRSPNQYHLRVKRNLWFSEQSTDDASEVALKQPIPAKQLILMIDSSFRSAGYAFMIEDNPDQNIQSNRKTYAPVALGSKTFFPAQLKMSIYSKNFCQSTWHFLISHTFCGKHQNRRLS